MLSVVIGGGGGSSGAVLGISRQVEHYPIQTDRELQYLAEGKKFSSLSAYINHFKENCVPAGTVLTHGVRQFDMMLSADF